MVVKNLPLPRQEAQRLVAPAFLVWIEPATRSGFVVGGLPVVSNCFGIGSVWAALGLLPVVFPASRRSPNSAPPRSASPVLLPSSGRVLRLRRCLSPLLLVRLDGFPVESRGFGARAVVVAPPLSQCGSRYPSPHYRPTAPFPPGFPSSRPGRPACPRPWFREWYLDTVSLRLSLYAVIYPLLIFLFVVARFLGRFYPVSIMR